MTVKKERQGFLFFNQGKAGSASGSPYSYDANKVKRSPSAGSPFDFKKNRVEPSTGSMPIPFAYKDHRVKPRAGSMPIPFAYRDHRVKPRGSGSHHPFDPDAYKPVTRYSEKVVFKSNRFFPNLRLWPNWSDKYYITGGTIVYPKQILVSKRDQNYSGYQVIPSIGDFTIGTFPKNQSVNGTLGQPKFDRKEKDIWNN